MGVLDRVLRMGEGRKVKALQSLVPDINALEAEIHALSDDALKHKTVEGHDGCRNADRLGPYPSAEEAGRALQKVEERNEEWDTDPKWNEDGPGSGDGLTDGTPDN